MLWQSKNKEIDMKRSWRLVVAIVGVVVVACLVVVLWPAPDPLAGVNTVALRFGDKPENGIVGASFESELHVVLGERNITIVTDESKADAVLIVDDVTVNLGDINLSLQSGVLKGKVHAECTLTDAGTGARHVMDFYLAFTGDDIEANLVPRKFWQLWK